MRSSAGSSVLVGRVRELEPVRENADDGMRLAVEVDEGPDDVRIRSEAPRPHAVTEQHHAVRAFPCFLLREEPPQPGSRPQQWEQRRRDAGAGQGGAVETRRPGGDLLVAGELLERLGALVEHGHRAVRQPHVRSAARPQRLTDANDRVGIGVRQRPQQDAVDDAEHRGVRAQAQREHQRHAGREPGASPQAADGVAQVTAQVAEPSHASFVLGGATDGIPVRCGRKHGLSPGSTFPCAGDELFELRVMVVLRSRGAAGRIWQVLARARSA